jgi:hypothetical protein
VMYVCGVSGDSFNREDYLGLSVGESFLLFLGEYLVGFSWVGLFLILLVFVAFNLAFAYWYDPMLFEVLSPDVWRIG